MTTEEKVRFAFADAFGDETTTDYVAKLHIENLTNDTVLSQFGLDSLDIIEVKIRLEETFEVSIPDEDIKLMSTYGDIIRYMKEKTS